MRIPRVLAKITLNSLKRSTPEALPGAPLGCLLGVPGCAFGVLLEASQGSFGLFEALEERFQDDVGSESPRATLGFFVFFQYQANNHCAHIGAYSYKDECSNRATAFHRNSSS